MTSVLDRLKVSALLTMIAGYLIFSYAFMLLRIPPVGFGIPLGELMLVFVLLGLNIPRVLSRMNAAAILAPFLLWWGWGLTRLVFDAAAHGAWALRDATQLIESLYLVVGFSLAADPRAVPRLARWLRVIVIICCAYGLMFIFEDRIIAMSPTIPGASGQAVPIFGSFATTGPMLLLGAFACVIVPADRPAIRMLRTLIAGFLIAFAVVMLQMRTTYLQLIAISGLLLFVRPQALGRLTVAFPLLLFMLLVVAAFDIRIAGRLTSEISLSFFWDHILAIAGIGATGESAVADAAGGVPLRLHWWYRLYDELTADAATLLIGLGYGIPLTDFRDELGVVTREPHNSIISVAARLGLIGFTAWLWMQAELFRAGIRAYLEYRRRGCHEAAHLPLLIVAFAILTLVGCVGEDNLEKPYYAIPYYTFWGFVLRMVYQMRVEARAGRAASPVGGVAGIAHPSRP